jgi:hypothetical protein
MKVILILMFSFSILAAEKQVGLLAQWHLRSKQMTKDVEASKKLPQYPNQLTIYLVLEEWIKKKQVEVVIAEGCQGEITKESKLEFNGWSYAKLYEYRNKKNYQDILTHIPLKLEAKFQDEIEIICGDDLELVKKHQLVLSDITGNTGFMYRLKQAREKKDVKKFKIYHRAVEKIAKKKISNPIKYLKQKIDALYIEEQVILQERNDAFVKLINSLKPTKLAIVLGARHMKDLALKLKDAGHKVINFPTIQGTLPNKGNL